MLKHCKKGFTLVELIIVILILGILAAIAIPQFATSSTDAKVATLQGDLSVLRNAINLYYHQHDGLYPGAVSATDGTTATTTAAAREAASVAQLTLYSDATGKTSATKNAALYPYGPYLMTRSIPNQPFATGTVVGEEISATADVGALAVDTTPVKGWKFSVETGELIANDATYSSY